MLNQTENLWYNHLYDDSGRKEAKVLPKARSYTKEPLCSILHTMEGATSFTPDINKFSNEVNDPSILLKLTSRNNYFKYSRLKETRKELSAPSTALDVLSLVVLNKCSLLI
jgi:hypothetical protein